ncbi:MAG: sulfatase-like hydrolase/transferase [bacterium]|nr:sulfatase-like hydrolase/transferase [bacterium]
MSFRPIATCWLLFLSLLACGDQKPTGPFNLIIISIDTLRADHVGAYGYAPPTTPNIDAFARDAVLFERCIASAPTTLASHASILTSLVPEHHGASINRKTRLADGIVTLQEILQDHGYATASFNGGIQLDPIYGLDRGFDVYESVKTHEVKSQVLEGDENRMMAAVERAQGWLREVEKPLFLFLHSYEIHHPYTPDSQRLERFDADYAGPLPRDTSVRLLRRINTALETISKRDLRHIIATYDAELHSADAAVGAFLQALRNDGSYDDSMIIVTSDHGEEFAEHGQVGWHSHSLYDELLQVPLIVKFPNSRFAGERVKTQVRGIDVAPTALAAMAIETPESFSGVDLGGRIGDEQARDLPAISMADSTHEQPLWSIRLWDWKLHDWQGERLFDLARDPGEKNNLASQQPERVAEIRRRAARLLQTRPTPEDAPAQPSAETLRQLRELGYVE